IEYGDYMIKLKNIISFFVSIIILLFIFLNFDVIYEKLKDIVYVQPELVINPGNNFTKEYDFEFVRQVDDYVPYSYDDLVHIFYSILNQGWDEFTFYCPLQYTDCLRDVEKISYNEVLLSDINNFVHPYNSYSTIKTLYDDMGEVTIKVKHLYSDDEIKRIDNTIDKMIDDITNDTMSDVEKIRALHDYIVNNTKYDITRANEGTSSYDSSRILGLLYDHYSICSGYSDTMAVMLNKLGIENYKVASETHVWNAVKLDDKWLHLDLTWDDPVSTSGKDILDHTYFLIDTYTLREISLDDVEHIYDRDIYIELN
ncbi:MAG: hypothetical protein K2H20_04050, partial [Bacilli bacterium]|nr:hypothetical protein [Bacilli bacterium]